MGNPTTKAFSVRGPGPESFIEIAPRRVRRRRMERRIQWVVLWLGVLVMLLIAPLLFVVFFPGQGPLPGNPVGYYAGVSPVVAVMALGAWFHTRRTVLAVNRVAIGANGLYPPFKPNQRLSKTDWFVPYRDIVSMMPVGERRGFVPAYDVTLLDGLTFQLNSLDLLVYVNEKEVRRYAKMLSIVKTEVEKPENRARSARGEDIVIPKERFELSSE